MNIRFELPEYVTYVLNKLEFNGFEAYVVGGSVRDIIMGNSPNDYDIATSALPEQVVDIFSCSDRVIETGIKHGTVTVMCENTPVEITTYRIDGDYFDSRRPESVTFTRSLAEDLARRDFTVNALAYNPNSGITDCFNGIGDIGAKIIKCIGNPELRFAEDALRILRALRFSVKLDFDIDKSTSDAIYKLSGTLSNISAERIQAELFAMFSYSNSQKLSKVLLEYKEIIEIILSVNADDSIYTSVCNEIEIISNDKLISLIYFICKISGSLETVKSNLQNLKVSKKFHEKVCSVFEILSLACNISNITDVKLLMRDYGANICTEVAAITDALNLTDGMEGLIQQILTGNKCYSLKQLSVTGRDLIDEFNLEGNAVGVMLDTLLLKVITGECDNDKSVLISKTEQILNTAES